MATESILTPVSGIATSKVPRWVVKDGVGHAVEAHTPPTEEKEGRDAWTRILCGEVLMGPWEHQKRIPKILCGHCRHLLKYAALVEATEPPEGLLISSEDIRQSAVDYTEAHPDQTVKITSNLIGDNLTPQIEKKIRQLASLTRATHIHYGDCGNFERYTVTTPHGTWTIEARGNRYDGGWLTIKEEPEGRTYPF